MRLRLVVICELASSVRLRRDFFLGTTALSSFLAVARHKLPLANIVMTLLTQAIQVKRNLMLELTLTTCLAPCLVSVRPSHSEHRACVALQSVISKVILSILTFIKLLDVQVSLLFHLSVAWITFNFISSCVFALKSLEFIVSVPQVLVLRLEDILWLLLLAMCQWPTLVIRQTLLQEGKRWILLQERTMLLWHWLSYLGRVTPLVDQLFLVV